MAISDWMRFQLAYGFGTVRAAKALEKWHSPTLLFHTEDWRLRQHGMGEEELRRVREAKDADLGKVLGFCERNGVKILTPMTTCTRSGCGTYTARRRCCMWPAAGWI